MAWVARASPCQSRMAATAGNRVRRDFSSTDPAARAVVEKETCCAMYLQLVGTRSSRWKASDFPVVHLRGSPRPIRHRKRSTHAADKVPGKPRSRALPRSSTAVAVVNTRMWVERSQQGVQSMPTLDKRNVWPFPERSGFSPHFRTTGASLHRSLAEEFTTPHLAHHQLPHAHLAADPLHVLVSDDVIPLGAYFNHDRGMVTKTLAEYHASLPSFDVDVLELDHVTRKYLGL